MSTITTKDGTEIYYKDGQRGSRLILAMGGPLSSDDRDAQMLFFVSQGFRAIAHDGAGMEDPGRRGTAMGWMPMLMT